MSGTELDREFKTLLAAVRPLLPSAPQAALACTVRWLQKLSALPPAQRRQRNQHLRALHRQLAGGAISAPFDAEPPLGQLADLADAAGGEAALTTPAVAADVSKQAPQTEAESVRCDRRGAEPRAEPGAEPAHSDTLTLIEEARALLRETHCANCPRRKPSRQAGTNACSAAPHQPSNDDEWSDVSSTSCDLESCASGDFALTLVAGTGHERCILLHRKHLVQLAGQSARIRRYEAALKHFLENPALLLGDRAAREGSASQLAALKKQLSDAERAKSESQRSARDANLQLQACQQLVKADSDKFSAQLAGLNGKLLAHQQQMRVDGEFAARQLAAVKSELESCKHRMRGDAESFRQQLATLNGEMQDAEEECKRQVAAAEKKTKLQLSALREQMQRESDEKLDVAKRKISRLHKVVRRYDNLKQRWSEEFEKKIHRLEMEKDLQLAKVRLEMQSERASCLLANGGDQMVAELEVKYQTLARQHEEASWRQRQRDLRRISDLERQLEAKSMEAGT